jgi:hypothetical protein
VLGGAKGGPERPNFTGDPTRKRGPYHRFLAARVDSSCRDDPGSKAKSMVCLSYQGRAPEYGAMARWTWLFSGARNRKPRERKRVAATTRERVGEV